MAVDEDKDETLKRDRPEEEADNAEEAEVSDRPSKIAKTSDESKEEEKEKADAVDDPPVEKDDCGPGGEDCGTDKGSSDDPPTDDGDATKESETKENDPKPTDPLADDTKTEEEAQVAAVTPSTEPSGLPNTAVDLTEQATVVNPDSVLEERAELDRMLVGRVIGKGGEQIRDLNARSGCRVDVDQDVPDDAPRIITYRGTRKAIDFAKQLVATLCSDDGRDAELPLGMATRKQLIVPSTSIGKVIGRGGEMIRELQTRSKCKIQVDHSGGGVVDPDTRQVIVTGTADAVVKAEEMIMFLVANPAMDASTAIGMLVEDKARGGSVWGSGPPYPNLPNQGKDMQGTSYAAPVAGGYQQQPGGYGAYGTPGMEMEIFYAAKTYMGRIIGQRGVTINDLQKRSGCDIQINQDVPHGQDCEISIKGSRQGIEMVKVMLREIIEMGPNHPYAGGAGAAAQTGGYGGASYPVQTGGYSQAPLMQAAYPYQQPAAQPYGQPYAYGAQPYQPAAYSQPPMGYQATPQPYGMPAYQVTPQQQYAQQPTMQQAQLAPASVWKTANTADGQTYYYNEATGATQWEKPAGM